jgi:hypothetical protein
MKTALRWACVRVVAGVVGFAAVLLLGAGGLRAVDFVRGDANGDRKISISDTVFVEGFLFFLGWDHLVCGNAADTNDDNQVDITDGLRIFNVLFRGIGSIPAPSSEPGPDPTPEPPWDPRLVEECASYGNGSPLEDPAAVVAVSAADVAGGSDRRAVITLAVSSSSAIAGLQAVIADEAGILEDAVLGTRNGLRVASIDFAGEQIVLAGSIAGGRVQVGWLPDLILEKQVPPGDGVGVLEVIACVKPGTPAGDYPLTLEAAELSAGCMDENGPCNGPDIGRAISPALASGTLHVAADVTDGPCDTSVTQPKEITILFQLDDATGVRGGSVEVPFTILVDRETQGFSYSADFDEEVLRYAGEEKLWEKPDGTPYEFERFEFDNLSRFPGNDGVDEGYFVGAAVISLTDTDAVLPPRAPTRVLEFELDVLPTAPVGPTEIKFVDGGRSFSGDPVRNKIIAEGSDVTPDLAGSFVFVDALIQIVPDGTPFVRGDSNGDIVVNISDASFTLNHLFLGGGEEPPCEDAADANDDGSINISDPIATLTFLFLGTTRLPPPNVPGSDPTPDWLTCASGSS